MLKDYLLRLEKLSWKTATAPSTTGPVVDPNKSQSVVEPARPSTSPTVPAQGGFNPVQPSAKPQITQPQQQINQVQQPVQSKSGDLYSQMKTWFIQNKDKYVVSYDRSWGWTKDPAKRLMIGKVFDDLDKEGIKINDPMIAHFRKVSEVHRSADMAAVQNGSQPAGPVVPRQKANVPALDPKKVYDLPASPNSAPQLTQEQLMERRLKMTNWIKTNRATSEQIPQEWVNDPVAKNAFGKLVGDLLRDKLPITNQNILSAQAQEQPENAGLDKSEIGRAAGSTENYQYQLSQLDPKNKALIENFSTKHADFLKQIKGIAFRDTNDPEISGSVASRFVMETFGPPQKAGNQDNRLAILLRPRILPLLEQYTPFAQRMQRENVAARLEAISEMPVNSTKRTQAINALNPLLKPSTPEAQDSIIDAMIHMTSGDKLDPALSAYWVNTSKKLALQELQKKYDADPTKLDDTLGEDGGSRADLVDAEKAKQRIEVTEGEGAIENYTEALKKLVSNSVKPTYQLGMRITDRLYNHNIAKDTVATMKVGGGALSVPDVMQSMMFAAMRNVNKVISPGNQKLKTEAFEVFKRDREKKRNGEDTDQGDDSDLDSQFQQVNEHRPTGDQASYGTNAGRVTVINQNAKNLDEADIDLSHLVKPSSIKSCFYQLGLIKQAILRKYQEGVTNPSDLTMMVLKEVPSILEKQKQELLAAQKAYPTTKKGQPKDTLEPDMPLAFHINENFVVNTINESSAPDPVDKRKKVLDPAKGNQVINILKSAVAPGSKVATQAMGLMPNQWTQSLGFMKDVAAQSGDIPVKARELLTNIIGLHKGLYNAPNGVVADAEAIPESLLQGKKWWEVSVDKLGEARFPQTQPVWDEYNALLSRVGKLVETQKKLHVDQGLPPLGRTEVGQLRQKAIQENWNSFPGLAKLNDVQKQELKQRFAWEKKMNGRTLNENTKDIWEHLIGKPMPEETQKYLLWRSQKKSRKSKNAISILLRRYASIYRAYEQRITKIASVKNSLSKVGATPNLESLISSVSRKAIKDLHYLSDLIQSLA